MRIKSRLGRCLTALMLGLVIAGGCLGALAESIVPAPMDVADGYAVDEEYAAELADGEDARDDVNYDPEEEETLSELLGDYEGAEDALAAVNGMTNILLIGLDARPKQNTGRSDTMIMLTLDADHNAIKLTSFMRDLYVEIPGRKNNRLNAAYVFGGPDLLIETLKQNFGVNIDHYVAVNFSVLASVIDQLGGLTLTVEDKYVPRINAVIKEDNKVLGISTKDGLIKEGGQQLLTGKQAQAYARYRYGTSDGDFGRTVRQREVILKCMEKVKDMSMMELVQLAINNLDSVSTDMSIMDMVALAPAALQLKDSEVKQLRIPIDKAYTVKTISGMWVMVPNRAKNLQAITDFILEEEA